MQVSVDGVLQVDGTDYNWTSDNNVQFVSAPASGTEVLVKRETPESDQIVQWENGSYVIAEDLNESDLQWLYNIQELYDKVEKLNGTVEGEAIKEVLGILPVEVDSTDNQKPVVSVDVITKAEAENDPTNPSWDTEDKLASPAAIDRVYKQIVGDGVGFPGAGNKAKLGQLRIDNTGALPQMFYWDTTADSWVELKLKGDKGDQGPAGPPPGLQSPPADATNVALQPGNVLGVATASVVADDNGDLKFSFGIPVGQTGQDSDVPGPVGPPPGLQSPPATATTVPNSGSSLGTATASVTANASGDLKFDFGIPAGLTGPKGDDSTVEGPPGPEGTAATIAVGTTTTLSAGSNATVANAGSSSAAVFNFGIPKGPKGDPGDGVEYKGSIDAVTDPEPSPKNNGDFYVSTSEGTSSWAGDVVVNTRIIWNADTNNWDTYPPVAGGGSSEVLVADSAPPISGLAPGQLWFNSNDGRLYVLYEDTNSTQWVDASPDMQFSEYWERSGTTLSPVQAADKVTSASTAADDPGNTLVTKDYVDSSAGAADLQSVTDNGNTTTNAIEVGSITAAGNISQGPWADDDTPASIYGIGSSNPYIFLKSNGNLNDAIILAQGGNKSADYRFLVKTDGSVRAAGDVIIGPNQSGSLANNQDGVQLKNYGFGLFLHDDTNNNPFITCSQTGAGDLFSVSGDGSFSAGASDEARFEYKTFAPENKALNLRAVAATNGNANAFNVYDPSGDSALSVTYSGDITAAGSVTSSPAANSYGFKLMGDANELGGIYRHSDGAFIWANDSSGQTQVTLDGRNGSGKFTGSVSIGGNDAAHTIDEYEEGTWTPEQNPAWFNNKTQIGRYTRIGNVVTVTCHWVGELIDYSATNAQTTITLPFPTAPNDPGAFAICVVGGGPEFGVTSYAPTSVYMSTSPKPIGSPSSSIRTGMINTGNYPTGVDVEISFDITYTTTS